MKKLLALTMAILMVLALAACAGGGKKPSSTTPSSTTTAGGTTDPDTTTTPGSTTDPDTTTTPGLTTDPDATTTPGNTTTPDNSTTPVGTTKPSTTTKPQTTTTQGGNTDPGTTDSTVWVMPTDWSTGKVEQVLGWDYPRQGNWQLLGFTSLDNATPVSNASAVEYSSMTSFNNTQTPYPYMGTDHNETKAQGKPVSGYYTSDNWYINHDRRWNGISFKGVKGFDGIGVVAHAGQAHAIVFTAPSDGDYTYSETVLQELFVAGGTALKFEVTVRKNGQVINTFTPSESNKGTTLTGTVTLEAGDILMFAFEQKTSVKFSNSQSEHKSNDPTCFKVSNVTVTQKDHICGSGTMTKHNEAPDFCAPGVTSYYSCYCGKLYKDASAKNAITEKAHNWKNGSCTGCSTPCAHDVTAADANCHKAAVCGICGYEVAPVTSGNHKDKNGTYRYIGNGKHQFNRTCCDSTDITSEACMYGNDNICDKCGHDKTQADGAPKLIAMANQTKKQIQVFDISTGNMNEPVWSYNITVGGVSGFKIRNYAPYGDVLLVTVGTNAELVAVDTKEVIWRTSNTPGNSHSLDIMPNGIIAVGGTTGHDVHFYNINGEDPTKILYELPLQHAHGVLWDPEYNVLWVTGDNHLWALNVTLNADGSVTVEKNTALSAPDTTDTDTHDLQPYRGDTSKLLISTSHYLYVYDKEAKTYTVLVTEDAIKGVGNFEDGGYFYMYYDGGNDNGQGGGWNTTYIEYVAPGSNTATKIYSDEGRFYKCRLWETSYQ